MSAAAAGVTQSLFGRYFLYLMKKTPHLGKLTPNNRSSYPAAGEDTAVGVLPGKRWAEGRPDSRLAGCQCDPGVSGVLQRRSCPAAGRGSCGAASGVGTACSPFLGPGGDGNKF